MYLSPSPIAAYPSLNLSPPTLRCLFSFLYNLYLIPPLSSCYSVFVFLPPYTFLLILRFHTSLPHLATSLWYPPPHPVSKPIINFFLPPQGCEASGGCHVKSQTGPVHLCTGGPVPELLRADSCLQPAHRPTSAAAHPTARVLQPGTACTWTRMHAHAAFLKENNVMNFSRFVDKNKAYFCTGGHFQKASPASPHATAAPDPWLHLIPPLYSEWHLHSSWSSPVPSLTAALPTGPGLLAAFCTGHLPAWETRARL